MGELINGRTPERIKANLKQCSKVRGCAGCEHLGDLGCVEQNIRYTLALIEHLESERDAAVRDLKLISHCYTCSNQDLDKQGVCKNSGGGGAPFMKCPGYVWDKKLPEPPKEDAHG